VVSELSPLSGNRLCSSSKYDYPAVAIQDAELGGQWLTAKRHRDLYVVRPEAELIYADVKAGLGVCGGRPAST
jgi:hypothetical protein